MAEITFKGQPIHTVGSLPSLDAEAPPARLTTTDLNDVNLDDYPGTRILNIFPSVDTRVCALSVRTFNAQAGSRDGVTVINVSLDLPFALKRFCAAEGLEGVVALSAFRSSFPDDYGVRMKDGPLAGLTARAVVVLDPGRRVRHVEQVPEIGQEPDYAKALAALP